MKNNILRILLVLIALVICICVYGGASYWYKNKKDSEIENKLDEDIIESNPLYSLDNYPKVDASLATQPLTNAFIKNFTGIENIDENLLDYSNTHPAYIKLINDEVDLIVVTEPSEEELKLARDAGVELEVIPVVKEGFVFYVNAENKVDNLSTEEIQKIYTGEITNWKQVGGDD